MRRKNCPTERIRGEKNCPNERNRDEKNRLQRRGVWRLYKLLFGAKKNYPVKSQLVLYIFKLSCKNFSEKS